MVTKVQKIRYCCQCRELLPLRCRKCLAHPDRKPVVQDHYDLPPILATGPCGCIKIACEVPEQVRPESCKRSRWCRPVDAKKAKNRVCSRECNYALMRVTRNKAVTVRCGYRKCVKPLRRAPLLLKRYKASYCDQVCYKMETIAQGDDRRSAEESRANLACEGECGSEVTEHKETGKNTYECLECGHIRSTRNGFLPEDVGAAVMQNKKAGQERAND